MMTSDDKVGGWVRKGQNHDDVILEWSLMEIDLPYFQEKTYHVIRYARWSFGRLHRVCPATGPFITEELWAASIKMGNVSNFDARASTSLEVHWLVFSAFLGIKFWLAFSVCRTTPIKSIIELTTCFHEVSVYESTNFFTHKSQLKKETNSLCLWVS